MSVFVWYVIVFTAKVIQITLATLRFLMCVRGRNLEAAIMGFIQAILYVVVLARVITSLDNPINLLVYAAGFAVGTYLGGTLEERMSAGYMTVEIVCKDVPPVKMAEDLRKEGFGVTMLHGEGREGPVKVLFLSLDKKGYPQVINFIEERDQNAFVTVLDARQTLGGFIKHRDGK